MTQELRIRLPNPERRAIITGARRSALRFCFINVYLFFFWISGHKTTDAELDELVNHGLVSRVERDWLKNYEGQKHSVVLDWTLEIARVAVGSNQARPLFNIICDLRTHQTYIEDMLSMPVPFQYFHLMNLMMCLSFVGWAYGMAMYDSWIATFIFMASTVIFLGMRELSGCLSDPFGEDAVDFPISVWLLDTWRECDLFLEVECPEIWYDPRNFEDAPLLWQKRAAH
mmetsp:Transcript_46303/g.104962  ORF Transcript_46303/g.104962 Transcript_46303/m.104962 type:complete len:228 (-) Transcript_46303:46-729(-)